MLHVLPNKQNKADNIVRTVCCSPQVPAPLPRPSQERSHQPPQPISTATALQCSYSTTSAATPPPVQRAISAQLQPLSASASAKPTLQLVRSQH